MSDIQGHYKRSDNGEQSFFIIRLNLHTKEAKEGLHPEELRNLIADRVERAKGMNEEIDFTVEVARYYDKEGD